MNHKGALSFVLILFLHIVFAQSFDKTKLDGYFDQLDKSNKFMCSVVIAENGKITYTNSTGFADLESQQKANINTKYKIGSISKTLTSVMILKALDEKKIKLETQLNAYFPTIKNANKITISNMLNHRSGIHNITNDADYMNWFTQKKSEKEMLQIIEKAGSDFEPDSKAEYSNSNYILLSYILEKLYKKPYSEILNEKIIKPIGLKNTYFGGKININNNESNSYKYNKNWIKEPETDPSIPMGAGGIVSTPSDLTDFAFALFNGKLISEKSLELMTTLKNDYGLGIFQFPFDGKISYGHFGGIDGFTSFFGYFPKEKIAIAITSNANYYNINDVSKTLLNAIFGKPFDIPNFKTYDITDADLDQYMGVYSSKDIPLKITITKSNAKLVAQATGQSSFELEASEKDQFKFDQAGIVLEFNPKLNTMILKQAGGIFTFVRE